MNFRPSAVPLITVDPYFSVWSCANELHGDVTRHWTEKPCPLLIGVMVEDRFYSMAAYSSDFVPAGDKILQTGLKVSPLSTEYTFENDFLKAKLVFTTPLILDRLDIMTRPVSYVEYSIEKKCDKEMKFIFGIGSRIAVADRNGRVKFEKTDYSLSVSKIGGEPLSASGDMVTIDWGSLHLCDTSAFASEVSVGEANRAKITKLDESREYNAYIDMPYLTVEKTEMTGVITLAYDEVYPIEYFAKKLSEYYTKNFDSFALMVEDSIKNYKEIKALCDKFDAQLIAEASQLSESYATLLALAYRQAVGAHKTVCDTDGNLLFLSKECESNGCIGTLDITYPSMPLFLKYNPDLVEGMLRPIVKYASSPEWPYDFVPHDVGQYPLANGQVYGMGPDKEEQLRFQMPIEESGNMLISLAAIKKYSGKTPALFTENADLMKKWADYLMSFGYDPGDQLCTDDFAGHLNHNCNLSIKAILGMASYSILSGDNSYVNTARELAKKWESEAVGDHGATRLTFDIASGWSLKYNIVWDSLLSIGLFSDEIKRRDVEFYKTKMNEYGVPLDSRKDYTKADWLMWSTCIYPDKDYFNMVCDALVKMINETPDRVPFTDWYYTSTAKHQEFQNRTVVAGLFINLLS